jgi:exosortase/archaeosortase family protein
VTGRVGVVVLRVAAIIVVSSAGFALLEHPARRVEARSAAGVVRLFGGAVWHAEPDAIAVVPAPHAPIRAVVTPACSALASMLAIASLASVVPVSARRRRPLAVLAAMTTVAIGNVVRIVASLGVGLVAGRQSLILFHDRAGSAFAFGYVLAGYVLFLFLVLPKEVPARAVAL